MSAYYVGVSEPWDFIGPDGKNIIKGKILKIVDNDCVIFKSNHLLEMEGKTSYILILLSRHKDLHFDNIERRNFWTVGGGLLFTDSYDNMNAQELEKNSKYFIIGSLRKE